MNRALIALGCLVVVLVAGALIAPSFIDWNKYKDPIQAEAERLTGRDVTVGGHLSFSVLPSPALSADDVRIANIPGAKAENFARLKSLKVKVALLPLLTGKIRVKQVTLVEPEIALEITADGTRNWIFANATNAPEKPAPGGSPRLLQAVRLDNFVIENGDITFHDERKQGSAAEQQVKSLNAVITARTLQGPVKATGQGVYRAVPVSFTLDAGQYSSGNPVSLSVELKSVNEPVTARFNGSLTDKSPRASVNGKLTVGGDDLGGLFRIIHLATGSAAETPGFASHKKFSLDTKVSGSTAEAKLDDVALTVGEANGSGAATLSLNAGPKFDATFQMNSVDLDALLKPGPKPGPAPGAPTVVDIAPKPAAAPGFTLPDKANGSLDLGIAALSYHDGTVRQIRFAAELKNGKISVTRASALLPGGSDVSVTGALMAEAGKPHFAGAIKGTSNNVRAILDWFNANPAGIPADRLTKLVLTSGVDLVGDTATLSDLDVTLDTSRITGTGSLALRARPALDLDVDIDRLNLDAYVAQGAETAPPAQTPASTDATPAAPPKPAGTEHPLAGLEDFDGSLKARVGHMVLFGLGADAVMLDGSLKDGVATLASFAADDVSGASVTATGSAQGFSGDIAYKADVDLGAKDLAEFLHAVDVTVPFATDSLGKANLKLGFDSTGPMRAVSVSGKIGATEVTASRASAKTPDAKQFDVKFDLKNPSLRDFSRQFAIGFKPVSTSADTPISLSGTVSGTNESAKLQAHGTVRGGSIDADGDLAALDGEPRYDLAVKLSDDDFGNLARTLGFDFTREPGSVGPVAASAQMKGTASHADLSNLKANLGETTASGSASLDLSGDVPKITASLTASEIVADQFLAKPTTGVEQAKAAGRVDPGMKRWSRARLGLDWMSQYAGEVELKADRLSARGYDVLEPDIKLLLDNGTLTVRQLTGQLFGGALDLRAVLRGQATPDLSLTFSLSNASVAGAMQALAGVNTATGTFSMNGSISGSGNSQFDIISDLTGSATVKAENGVLRGFDLKRIATGAPKIKTMDDVTKLLSAATSQGTTPYKSIQATLRFDNGTLTAQNVATDIDSASGSMDVSVDLPRWTASVDSRFTLKDLAGSPPIGIVLTGPVNSPRRDVRTADMEKYLAKNVDATLLKGVIEQDNSGLQQLLGSDKPPAAPAPKAPAQSPPQ